MKMREVMVVMEELVQSNEHDVYFVEECNYSKKFNFVVVDTSSYDEPVAYFKTLKEADKCASELNRGVYD